MIIKPMAIIRCPYCHAIIDENDKYCNNCGTQLLFTEDEEVEEEIPGEKIIDADVEEKDYTVDEPEDEKRPAAPRTSIPRSTRSSSRSSARRPRRWPSTSSSRKRPARKPRDDVTEEVILVDEIAASEAKDKDSRIRAEIRGPKIGSDGDEEEEDEEKRKRTRTRKRTRKRKKSRTTRTKTKRKTRRRRRAREKEESAPRTGEPSGGRNPGCGRP